MQSEQTADSALNEGAEEAPLSLYLLLDPEVLANPYPLYHRLRAHDPVHWDPYLHAWIVTRYDDVVTVLTPFFRRTHADTGIFRSARGAGGDAGGPRDGAADALHGSAGAYPAAEARRPGVRALPASVACGRTSRTSPRNSSTRLLPAEPARSICWPTSPNPFRPS